MSKIVSTRTIGAYRLSIADDGALTIQAAHLHNPLIFDGGQAQELLQWFSEQKDLYLKIAPAETVAQQEVASPAESSEEIVQHVITDAIALARERYPANLDLENRDRFIDQITRDPLVKPLMAQGKISRKQIMLWIEQRLGSNTPSPWSQDTGRGRKSR